MDDLNLEELKSMCEIANKSNTDFGFWIVWFNKAMPELIKYTEQLEKENKLLHLDAEYGNRQIRKQEEFYSLRIRQLESMINNLTQQLVRFDSLRPIEIIVPKGNSVIK